MRYVHTNIISKDWRSLADFYIKVFNCEVKPPEIQQSGEWLEKGTGVRNAALQGVHLILPGYGGDGPTLEIYQYHEVLDQKEVESNKRGFGHIAFEVDDVEETMQMVIRNGGKPYGELVNHHVDGKGLLTFVYVRDPEGNIIELQSWKK